MRLGKLLNLTAALFCLQPVSAAELKMRDEQDESAGHNLTFSFFANSPSGSYVPANSVHSRINVFTRPGDYFTDSKRALKTWVPPKPIYERDWKPDGEWLLFVRRWKDSEQTIDHVVNLNHPLQLSSTSAVSADGNLLVERGQILAAVIDRLESSDEMISRQKNVRRIVDRGRHWPGELTAEDGDLEKVAPWLGGFQLPADIDVWDTPKDDRSFDEDLWIRSILAPADKSYRNALFSSWDDYLREDPESRERLRTGFPLSALIN